MKRKKYIYTFLVFVSLTLCYFAINSIRIYNYSFEYSELKSDVAIVLGAGTDDNKVSPIYRERINHGIYLYNKGIVKKIMFTGGLGKGQKKSDSEIAKIFAISQGVPENDILIEEKSKVTDENLKQAKIIMDSLDYSTALIVSDPLHMKRAMFYANKNEIASKPSPTKTSMYQSNSTRIGSLIYETFYLSLGQIVR